MRKYIFLAFLFAASMLEAQELLSAEQIASDDTTSLRFIYSEAKYNVETYKITYTTTDVDGSATIASGALMIPVSPSCDFFPLVSYGHGTVLLREDVPSRNNTEATIPKLIASTGKVTIAADYLGLGDNPGLHPYLHSETQATATIDMIRACRDFIADSLTISLNEEVFLTGYSQGGHAAMATAKYIQDNDLLSEFSIRAAGPASGPYNLSGTQSRILMSNETYSNPAYVCYLLFAYNRVYGTLFSDYSDILKSPYDTLIPPYFDGTHDISEVNALLPNRIGDFMQDSVRLNFTNDSLGRTHPLWRALSDNDNYDWAPSFPVELYYCTRDEQVNFKNALDAETAMQAHGANVTAVNKGPNTHFGCLFPSLEGAILFFEGYISPCQQIGIAEAGVPDVSVFPNPAVNTLHIRGFGEQGYFRMFDVSGRPVKEISIANADPVVDISDLAEGIYYLQGENKKTRFSRKIVIRR